MKKYLHYYARLIQSSMKHHICFLLWLLTCTSSTYKLEHSGSPSYYSDPTSYSLTISFDMEKVKVFGKRGNLNFVQFSFCCFFSLAIWYLLQISHFPQHFRYNFGSMSWLHFDCSVAFWLKFGCAFCIWVAFFSLSNIVFLWILGFVAILVLSSSLA